MTGLHHSLNSLSLNDDIIDITEQFFQIASKLQYSKISKANEFSLLHGTHALEILNPRLDTYLLSKTDYDLSKELSLLDTVQIIINQFKSISCWLTQNISLPCTILSNEYILQILINYTQNGELNTIYDIITSSGSKFNIIIYKFSIILIQIVKLILNLALKSQIYEDEDLNTSTMNLNWFNNMTNNEIFKNSMISNNFWNELYNESPEDVEYLDFIKNSFQILQSLISIESIFQWNIPLFKLNESKEFNTKFQNKLTQLNNTIIKLKEMQNIKLESTNLPNGCFNLNSQILLDNQAPPKQLHIFELDWNQCILSFISLFEDIGNILQTLKSKNSLEFKEWFNFLENKRNNSDIYEINGLHIIARIIFYNFFNNNSINYENIQLSTNNLLNIENYTFMDFFYQYLKEITLKNSKIDLQYSNKGSSNEITQQLDYYFENLSLLFKEVLFLPSLNPSRQRQFKCKELKYWNLRQNEVLNLEEYFKSIGFYNKFDKNYPLTFTIILFKLQCIGEIILKSIELQLFKDIREHLSVYYQLTLISYQLNIHYQNLISMVKLTNNSNMIYLTYLKNKNNLIYQLSIMKSKHLEILTILGFNKLPKNLIKNNKVKINEELLFNLQWKQFNNITEPEMLKYGDFKNKIDEIEKEYKVDNYNYIKTINEDINNINKEFKLSNNFIRMIIKKLDWFKELEAVKIEEIDLLNEEMIKSNEDINSLIEVMDCIEEYDVIIETHTRHCYFPGFKIVKNSIE